MANAKAAVPDLLTVAEVADRLGFTTGAVRDACKRGDLGSSKLLGQYRVSEVQLAAFVAAGAVSPEAPVSRRRPVVAVSPSRAYPVAGSFRERLRAKEQGG